MPVWFTPDRRRVFDIPADAEVEAGDLALTSLRGGRRSVAAEAVAAYELDRAGAQAALKAEVEGAMSQLTGALGGLGALLNTARDLVDSDPTLKKMAQDASRASAEGRPAPELQLPPDARERLRTRMAEDGTADKLEQLAEQLKNAAANLKKRGPS